MKKIIAVFLICVTALVAFSACNGKEADSDGTISLVIEKSEGKYDAYEVELSELKNKKEGVVGALELLEKKESLAFEMSDGPYGKYITKIGSLEDGKDGKYITIYTSFEKDFDVSSYADTIEYKGQKLTTAGVGISELTVKDGIVILIRLKAY